MVTSVLIRQRGVAKAWVRDGSMIIMTAINSEDSEYANGLTGDCRVFDEEFSESCAAADREFGLVDSSKKATPTSDGGEGVPPPSPAPTSGASVRPAEEESQGHQARSCLRAHDPNVSNLSAPSPTQAVGNQPAEGLPGSGGKRVSDSAAGGVRFPPAGRCGGNEGTQEDKENRVQGRPPRSKRAKNDDATAVSTAKSKASVETKAVVRNSRSHTGPLPPALSGDSNSVDHGDHRDSACIADEIAELRATPLLSMRVVDLRAALKKLGASSTGVKAVLQGKLQEALDTRIAELERTLSNAPGGEHGEEKPQPSGPETDNDSIARSTAEQAMKSSVAPKVETEVKSPTRISVARISLDVPTPVQSSPKFHEGSLEASEARAQGQREGQEGQRSPATSSPMSDMETATEVEVGRDVDSGPMEVASDGTHCKEQPYTAVLEESTHCKEESYTAVLEESTHCKEESYTAVLEESQLKPSSEIDEANVNRLESEPLLEHDKKDSAVVGEHENEQDSQRSLPSPQSVSARGSIIPVAENIVEIIPASSPDDSSVPLEEDVGEVRMEDGADASESKISDTLSVEPNKRNEVATGNEPEAGSTSLERGSGAVDVEEGSGGSAAANEAEDAGESSFVKNDPVEGAPYSPSTIANTKMATEGLDSSNHQPQSCKLPCSDSTSRRSMSPSTSGDSFAETITSSRAADPGEGTGHVRVGEKRPLETPRGAGSTRTNSVSFAAVDGTAMSTNGQTGGGEGMRTSSSSNSSCNKKFKLGKDKISLQEHMSRLRKDYAEKKSKVGTPRGASKAVTGAAGSADTFAEVSVEGSCSSSGSPSLPAPVAVHESSGKTAKTAMVPEAAEVSASATLGVKVDEPSAPSGETMAVGREAVATASTKSAAGKKPSNLVSTMHSFLPTLVKADNAAGAGANKWDRHASGAGTSARATSVPALRKAEETRLLAEKRVRQRAEARLRLQAASHSTVSASVTAAATGAASGRADQRDGVSGVVARMAATRVAMAATQARPTTYSDDRDSSEASAGGSGPSFLAPLRVTGMLPKLVPDASNRGGLAPQALSDKPKPGPVASDLPGPFRPSIDNVSALGAGSKHAESAADGDAASVASRSSVSSTVSGMSNRWGGGAGATSVASSSETIERRIRDQRAQIEAKRNARKEKLLAEEEKKKAELESKKLREAARLEAARRAKHEADARVREQKALRQAEAERRREQERSEREAKEAKEREEKEAKRMARLEAKEAAERAHKAAALAAAKKTKAMNVASNGVAPTLGGPPAVMAILKPTNAVVTSSKPSHPLVPVAASMPSMAPAVTTAVLKPSSGNVVATQASIASSSGSSASSAVKSECVGAAVAGVVNSNSYEISDHDGSTSESDSDEEEERRRMKSKKIPSWAKGSALSIAVMEQYTHDKRLDPDTIFPQVFSCDLEAIFPVNKSKYHRRGSSANWAPDRVTPQEILTYKRSVGIEKSSKP